MNFSSQKVLAVIPARGGSKGIPGKNIIKVNGIPLLEYTIRSALESSHITDIALSSDSCQILSICNKYNQVRPILRPSYLADDNSSSYDAVIHALSSFEEFSGVTYDIIIMLQPTTPFRETNLIDNCLISLNSDNFDSVLTLVDVGAIHPQRMYDIDANGKIEPLLLNQEDPMAPRQSLKKYYIRSGDVYAIKRSSLFLFKSLIGSQCHGYVISPDFAINIDTPLDLELANILAPKFNQI